MRDPVLAMVGKVFGRNENKCDLLLRFSDFPKILNILIQNYFFIHPTLTLFGKVKIALNSIEGCWYRGLTSWSESQTIVQNFEVFFHSIHL